MLDKVKFLHYSTCFINLRMLWKNEKHIEINCSNLNVGTWHFLRGMGIKIKIYYSYKQNVLKYLVNKVVN